MPPEKEEKKSRMDKKHVIDKIETGSIAEELGLPPGDILISINGTVIGDVFDYRYLIHDEFLTVAVQKADGEEWELEIEKDYDEDLGIVFENGLMDEYRSCRNHCIFCFIDQMPEGLRETLYFKDDDARLSFLQGNYVTLTNLSEDDIGRIITYRLAPINISVQTTNPALRCEMLNNRFAGEALKKIDRLFEAGIAMNGQIVLCKGINDGEELDRSIRDLVNYCPYMESVSVVPVGLTKYRKGLYPLAPFSKEDAEKVLALIHGWQNVCMERHGTHFVHASDEWYLLAGRELPPGENYDGYLQLENGVGMLRLLIDEFAEALAEHAAGDAAERGRGDAAGGRRLSIATGFLAAPFLKKLADEYSNVFPGTEIVVYPIRNDFFGERITVAGLLTGRDIAAQLKGRQLGERLLLPCSVLKEGEDVFLDDMTLAELKMALQVEIDIVKSSGRDLFLSMHGR